jgi:prophage regulatory protein
MPDNSYDDDFKLVRRKKILDDLGIDSSTLWKWIKSGRFPAPIILNEGEAKELAAWRLRDYREWQQSLPQRPQKSARRGAYPTGYKRAKKNLGHNGGPPLEDDDDPGERPPKTKPVIGRPK